MRRRKSAAGLLLLVFLAFALVLAGVVAARRPAVSGPVVGVATTDVSPFLLALDARDGRALIGSFNSSRVRVLDTRTARFVYTVSLLQRPSFMYGGAPGGSRVFILGQPGNGPVNYTISAVDLRSGRVRIASAQPSASSAYLAVDARRSRLFVMTIPFPAVNVDVYDATSLRRLRTTSVSNPTTLNTSWGSGPSPIVADARTGRVFASHAESNSVGVLDAASGRLLRTTVLRPRGNLSNGASQVAPLILAERLGRVYTVDYTSGTVNTLDAASGRLLHSATTGKGAYFAFVDERNRRLYVPHSSGATTMLDAATGQLLSTLPSGGAGPSWPSFNVRTGRVFFVGYRGVIDVRDGLNGRLIGAVSLRAATGLNLLAGAAVDERSGRVFVVASRSWTRVGWPIGPGAVVVMDGRSGRVLRTVRTDSTPSSVVVDGDNRRALVFDTGGATAPAPDPWGWLPPPLRQRLPFLPRPPRPHVTPGSVTVLDTSRL